MERTENKKQHTLPPKKTALALRSILKSLETLGPLGAPIKAVDSYKDLVEAKIHEQKTEDLIMLLEEFKSLSASEIGNLQHEIGISRQLLTTIAESVQRVLERRRVLQAVSSEEFYRLGSEIVENSTVVRFAAKTPALLLPQERLTYWRKEYYSRLISKIKESKIQAFYLFALPTTYQAIVNVAKHDPNAADSILEDWYNLLKFENLHLRYAVTTDFISSIIGDNKVLIGWKLPRSTRIMAVTLLEEQSCFYVEVFDQIFSEASNNNTAAIRSIRQFLRKTVRNKNRSPSTT